MVVGCKPPHGRSRKRKGGMRVPEHMEITASPIAGFEFVDGTMAEWITAVLVVGAGWLGLVALLTLVDFVGQRGRKGRR